MRSGASKVQACVGGVLVFVVLLVITSACGQQHAATKQEQSKVAEAHQLAALRLRTAGDLQGALVEQQKVITLLPKDAAQLTVLASIYMDSEQWDNAQKMLEKALQIDARDAVAYDLQAQVFEQRGDKQRALQARAEAFKLEPANKRYIVSLGVAQELAGDNNAARISYERALRIDAGDPYALYRLAELEIEEGNRARGIELLKRAANRISLPNDADRERDFIEEARRRLLDLTDVNNRRP